MKRAVKVAGFGIATAALLFGPAPAGAGQTVTYKGTGSFTAHRELMPLANGGAAVHVTNAIVATIEPSKPGFIDGDCAGLGYLAVDGKYSVDTYCTFAETGEDAFDIRAKVDENGGSVEVIGGSGKWSGATGSGKLKSKWHEGARGSYTYEFTITTP